MSENSIISEYTNSTNSDKTGTPSSDANIYTEPVTSIFEGTIEAMLTEKLTPVFGESYYELGFDNGSCIFTYFNSGGSPLTVSANYQEDSFELQIMEVWRSNTYYCSPN